LNLGEVDPSGEVIEGERVGFAYLKPTSRMFRLKLWMFSQEQYFLGRSDSDPSKYFVFSLDEFRLSSGEVKTSWNQVGTGEVYRSFIRLRFNLIPTEIYLCLHPNNADAAHVRSA
jgi:hypothetical protein